MEQITTNASDACRAMCSGINLYRGVTGFYDNYAIVDPTLKKRKSANTHNYYTLMMDNLPSWQGWPKRSRSLICSTSKKKTMAYSEYDFDNGGSYLSIYQVLPFNGAKLAVCPRDDIWTSFAKVFGYNMGGKINGTLVGPLTSARVPATGYRSMMQGIFENREKIMEFESFVGYDLLPTKCRPFWEEVARTKSIPEMISVFNEKLSPEYNNFHLLTSNNQTMLADVYSREVWTDSKCYLINVNSNLHRNLL